MKKIIEKGEYAYLQRKKRIQLMFAMVLFLFAVGMYVGGYYAYKKSNANIFTVLSILTVLPAAKFLMTYFVIFPFKSVEESQYQKVKEILSSSGVLFTNMVFTSTEKVMNLDYLVVKHGCVIGLLGKQGQDSSYIQSYIVKGIHNWADDYKVKVLTDYQKFVKEISVIDSREVNEKEEANVIAHLKSLIV